MGAGGRGPGAGGRPLAALARGVLLLALLAVGCGCGRYADFSLPAVHGGAVEYAFEVRPEPVLTPGTAGEWDAGDVLNPSVVRHGEVYFNFYSGYDGNCLAHRAGGLQ